MVLLPKFPRFAKSTCIHRFTSELIGAHGASVDFGPGYGAYGGPAAAASLFYFVGEFTASGVGLRRMLLQVVAHTEIYCLLQVVAYAECLCAASPIRTSGDCGLAGFGV